MAYMSINWSVDQHGTGLPANTLASEYGNHIMNVKLTSDTDNGMLVSIDTSKQVSFDVFEEKAVTSFEGTILQQNQDGTWLVLVTDPGDALFVYQLPLNPHDESREFLKESAMYNAEGDIIRAYVLSKYDRISVSEENFNGTPEAEKTITGVADKKMTVGA